MAVRIADTLKQQNNLTTFPVAYGEDIWLDKNKGSGTKNYSNLQEMFNNDELGGNNLLVTIMPTASETYLDTVLLYIGETGTYKYGTYYKCISDGETPPTYSWVDAEIGGGTSIFYGTMDEWDALSTDAKKQYDYMADDDAGGSYIDAYSTTETKTNKVWIDGKPIYRKVVVDISPNTYVSVSDDIETVTNIFWSATSTNFTSSEAYNWGSESGTVQSDVWRITASGANYNKFYCRGAGGIFSSGKMTLVVEYTKTTD